MEEAEKKVSKAMVAGELGLAEIKLGWRSLSDMAVGKAKEESN